jgi:hypothetical protein
MFVGALDNRRPLFSKRFHYGVHRLSSCPDSGKRLRHHSSHARRRENAYQFALSVLCALDASCPFRLLQLRVLFIHNVDAVARDVWAELCGLAAVKVLLREQ